MLSKNSYKSERELILSDPIVCDVLKVEAKSVGVTVEEYCDCFLNRFYSNPEIFISIVDPSKG